MNVPPTTPDGNNDHDLDDLLVDVECALVAVPAVMDEFPPELQLVVGRADPALTSSERSSPPLLEPETCSQHRLWADPEESHGIIVTTAFGVPQTGPATRGRTDEEVKVDEDWDAFGPGSVPTKKIGSMRAATKGYAATRVSVPIEDALTLVPAGNRAAFRIELKRLFPGGKIPGKVADRLDAERVAMHAAGKTPEEFVRYGIGNALDQDRKMLGQGQRQMCGAWTKERRVRGQGREGRTLRRMLCMSHRCPRCGRILAARQAAKIQAQVDSDLAVGRDCYALLSLTVDPKGHQNPATACRVMLNGKNGPWRRVRKWLQKNYADAAYHRTVEFCAGGWAHVHVLIRSKILVDAMLEESGLDSVEELRARVLEVKAENDRRKAAGIAGRLRSPYSKLKGVMRKVAVTAGWGRDAFDFDVVLCPDTIGTELAKASQVDPNMPRLRRFQHSIRNRLGKGVAFFDAGVRESSVEATVPPVETHVETQPGGGLGGSLEVKDPEGAPKLQIGADVTPGRGHLRVRIETATTDDLHRCGERLVLSLRVLEPEVFAHLKLRCTIPKRRTDDIGSFLRTVAGIMLHPSQFTFDDDWLVGKQGLVFFEPKGSPDETTGKPLRWDRFTWLTGPVAPEQMAAEVTNLVPLDALDAAATPAKVEGDLVEHAIHFAPIEKVVEAYAKGRQERFCGAQVEAAWDDTEGLVRRLVACEEALRERVSVEALADCIDLLRALELLGPDDIKAANDLPAIIAGVQALMAQLVAQEAKTA